jgi:hypothetical protein
MFDASRMKETLRTLKETAGAGLKGVKIPRLAGLKDASVARLAGLKKASIARLAGLKEASVSRLAGLKDTSLATKLAGLKEASLARLAGLKDAGLPARLRDVEKLAALPAKTLEREHGRAGFWLLLYMAFLALLAFLNLFIRPEHPHFGADGWFGFWPVFGLGVGLAMIFVMKRIVQPLIARQEEYYDDL